MMIYKLKLEELHTLVEDIGGKFSSGVVILRGDLAAGKTTFVKEFVKFLGVSDNVTSPTFSLQQCYGERVFHYDMYNHGLDHFVSLGMLEELDKDALHFVEWGDDELIRILSSAGISTLIIDIEKTSNETRQYKVDYAHA
ncbi:tRNA (adenosine(37)-N6)-threonylcarbamoyltransferase complex ATPase subunit type 1 TsaE [Candidatus Sulfurimonas baltica]|uniref:tRNA threonylcarbamoyladenosine biosynthesis protein TsaE n=1 Tax=Candidatus Sulfurimonas baltica TaxID=2740404 RepID=A0A7S7RP54_9BACT|nr:tRNA (adenosine(37)-N6)-threonylcarbamoyltransferase complex ATPase subunit type 1 TsaE [Candidatus Sulfurimonas baltica]QOY53128.1 tRNA (adenosine(37)-N6)-threonylcarbamoyltransferase complex ATPase subunit type 1 TsaE [Candidatus Sulfurimonas baltica]